MKRIEGKIHTPEFSADTIEDLVKQITGIVVNYRFKDDVVIGKCDEAFEKDGEIIGKFTIDNEYIEKGLKSGNLGYSIGFIKQTDKDGNIKNVYARNIAILPIEMIPTPECRNCTIGGKNDEEKED